MARIRFAPVLLVLLSLRAPAANLSKPIFAQVFLKAGGGNVSGNVTQWDDTGFTIHVGSDDRALGWRELSAASAYTLRSRLIDRNSAGDWLSLGQLGWEMGAKDQARIALMTAARMNPSLKPEVSQILATPTTQATRSLLHPPTSAPVKYMKSTPQQDAEAIVAAQAFSAKVADEMKLKFTELQTQHFIVFTDWDPRDFEGLKTNVEGAYAAVSRQFDIPVKDNVFVGKLPVFMFKTQEDFMHFSQAFDDLPAIQGLLGYYAGHGDGTGHMAMWQPRTQVNGAQGKNAKEQWAYTLTHEFTHAFVDRYKSNRHIPRWLNEGLAEVIAQGQFPQPGRRAFAREMALLDTPMEQLFDDDNMPGGEYYPVMQTMVEMLIAQNRKTFLTYFDAIKDGVKPEMALKQYYSIDYPGLIKAWRKFIVSAP